MIGRIAGVMALAFLAGCATDPPNRYFDLSPVQPASGPKAAHGGLHLAAVYLPGVTDRPQLVVRTGPNTVAILEFDRWAEPLDRMTQRILAQDLYMRSALPAAEPSDLSVYVAIDEFMTGRDGEARLSGRWWTRGSADDRSPAQVHAFSFVEPGGRRVGSQDAAALSRLLGQLADDISRD